MPMTQLFCRLGRIGLVTAMALTAAAACAHTATIDAPAYPPLPAQAERADWNWADDTQRVTQGNEFAASKAVCRRLRKLEPPASDRPDAATAAALADCDSEQLYYGIGVAADPVRARQCAFVEAASDAGKAGAGGAFSGTAMLMTIYANGVGAGRNLDLATSLACRIHGAAMESSGRIRHLQELKAAHDASTFSYCDDITSGYAGGVCAAHEASMVNAQRAARFASLTKDWSAAGHKAFESLSNASDAYVQASGDNEVDLSGTARAAFVIERKQALEAEFAAVLKALETGDLPVASADAFQKADTRLNAVYRQLMQTETGPDERGPYSAADSLPWSTVTKRGIRITQRAWLRYRDAWLTFAAMKYPATRQDSLRTRLTRERIRWLRDVLPST